MASILFNITELADYLHISVSLLRKLVRRNEVPYNRIGVKIMFQKNEIDKWLKDNMNSNE